MGKDILCVIPARKGSKGLPGKNYRMFYGKPLFIWSVLAALDSEIVDTVVVSSNCEKTKDYFLEFVESLDSDTKNDKRILWIDRPAELCEDKSTTESCLLHALYALNQYETGLYKYVITLQPTSPIRLKGMIDNAFYKMLIEKKKTLFSVSAHTPFFVQKKNGSLMWHYEHYNRKMRQNLNEEDFFYHDDGSLYITEVGTLLSTNCRLDKSPSIYLNNNLCSLQIDTDLDFRIMEKIMESIM